MKTINKIFLTAASIVAFGINAGAQQDKTSHETEKTSHAKEQSSPAMFDNGVFQETLPNGLRIVVVPLKTNGAVRFGIVYNVGCADDPNCKVGLSHFLEHMMFKGTKKISGERFKYLIDKYNAYTNACTDDDYTMYYYVLNKQFLKIIEILERDRMQNLSLTDGDVQHEQNVIMEERYMRCDANPEVKYLYDAVPRLLYMYSSYAYNGIGYPHHIKAYTKRALQKHYKRYYAPNNAVIVVVGDVNPQDVMSDIKRIFGDIKKTHDIKRDRVVDPEDFNISYTMDRVSDKITKKELELVYKIPRKKIDTLKKLYTARLALECLCGTARSLMAKKFVEKDSLLHSVNGYLTTTRFDKSYVFIESVVSEKSTLKNTEKTILDYIDHINSSNEFTPKIFEATKKRMQNQFLMMNDNLKDMFEYVVGALTIGYEISDAANAYDILSGITYDDVKNWLKDILHRDNKTLTIYNRPQGSL